MEIKTYVAGGLPCIARVISYSGACNNRRGHPDDWLPDDPKEIEFELLTLKGKPAAWIERRASDKDRDRICGELSLAINDSSNYDYDDY